MRTGEQFYFYDGLRIQTYENLHEKSLEIIKKNFHSKIKILDLATGEGALAKRLKDSGYDVVVTSWNDKVKYLTDDVKVYNLNLDKPFDETCFNGEKFACVTAVEIIEHLASPLNFLLNLQQVLLPGALVIVTMPNVESLISRMQILYRGFPNSFSGEEVRRNRHISMLNSHTCKYIFGLSGFNIIDCYYLPEETFHMGFSVRSLCKVLLFKGISKFLKGNYKGASVIYVLTNDKPIKVDREHESIY